MLSSSHGIASSANHALASLQVLGFAPEVYDLGEPGVYKPPLVGRAAGGGSWLIVVNAPELPWAVARIGAARLLGSYISAVWVYELERVPRAWAREARLVNDVVAPSKFAATAIASRIGRAVGVAPFAVVEKFPTKAEARKAFEWGDDFVVTSLFDMRSSAARKNPFGSIIAFRSAFGSDPAARLVIKAQNLGDNPAIASQLDSLASGARIEIVGETWPKEKVRSLLSAADAMVSLHRSEGFGLTIAESMIARTPVIATDCSGAAELLTPATSWPIPFRLIRTVDPQNIYRTGWWADPDLTAASLALRQVRSGGSAVSVRVNAAAAKIASRNSPMLFAQGLGRRFWMNVASTPENAALLSVLLQDADRNFN